MRSRLVFVVVMVLVTAAFCALNWSEVNRSSQVSFGFMNTDAPAGLVLLGLLGITLVVFLLSSAMQESRHLIAHGRNARTLEAQRELAEKAEASRFTDLRQQLDTHLRDNRRREEIAATEFHKSMVETQRELRTHLETINQTLATQLRELEARLDTRMDRLDRPVDAARVAEVPVRDRVKL